MVANLKVPRPRGVDFFINWSMSAWSEERVIEAINSTNKYIAFRYGVSRAGPPTFEEFKRYYERIRRAQQHGKRPDLVVFHITTYNMLSSNERDLLNKLMDIPNSEADSVVKIALFGVEVEFSRWHVGKMIEYQKKQKSTSILGPTFTIKEEDLPPLLKWMRDFEKEVLIIQTFYDRAYVVPLSKLLKFIYQARQGQVFQGVKKKRDSKTKKDTYFISCLIYGELFGYFDPLPSVEGEILFDDRGQLWPAIKFVGGKLKLSSDAERLMDKACKGIIYRDVFEKLVKELHIS